MIIIVSIIRSLRLLLTLMLVLRDVYFHVDINKNAMTTYSKYNVISSGCSPSIILSMAQ